MRIDNIHLMSIEMNFNKILNKFDRFHNDTNVIKTKIINKMK